MPALTTGASLTGAIVSRNVSDASSAPSLALTLRSSVTFAFKGGVPENVRAAASNVSHDGKAEPSDRVAVYVRVVLSTSAKAPSGTWNVQGMSSIALCSAIPTVTGASLTGVTVSVNLSERSYEPSLAVTLRSIEPLKSRGGVPEKVRVAASNASQAGSAEPSHSVAV